LGAEPGGAPLVHSRSRDSGHLTLLFAEVTFRIEETVERSGYDILVCHSRNDPLGERLKSTRWSEAERMD
jgi:DNA-binding LacI/PurR family transcriptional regulator